MLVKVDDLISFDHNGKRSDFALDEQKKKKKKVREKEQGEPIFVAPS